MAITCSSYNFNEYRWCDPRTGRTTVFTARDSSEARYMMQKLEYEANKAMQYYQIPADYYANQTYAYNAQVWVNGAVGISPEPKSKYPKCKSCNESHDAKFDWRGRCQKKLETIWKKRQVLFKHRGMKPAIN